MWLNTPLFGKKESKYFWSYFCLVCQSLLNCFLGSSSKNGKKTYEIIFWNSYLLERTDGAFIYHEIAKF